MPQLVASAPFQVEWQPLFSRPLQAGEVRLHTRLSAISVASELSLLRDGPFPRKLGYQTLGTVTEAAPETGFSCGQRVVSTLGHTSGGIASAGRVFAVPDHMADRQSLCLVLGEETHKGIRKVAPQTAENVLIAGAGLLGLLSVFNLTRRGIADVTVLEPDPQRRALAQRLGAKAFAPDALPHDQFDVGLECSASPAGFGELLRHLRPAGRCVVLSDGNWGGLVLPPEFHARELSLVASSDGEDYQAYASWLWQHADSELERLFQQTIRPDELPATVQRLRQWPRPVSVVVDWT